MEKIINNLSGQLQRELELTEDNREIVAYGIYIFLSTVIGLISIVIVGWLLGVLKLALAVVLTASGLRILSGGAHSACLRNCTLLGVIVSPGIALSARSIYGYFIPQLMYALVVAVGLLTLWSILAYAPADNANKPINNEMIKGRLRRLSLLYLIIWFVVIITIISGVFPTLRNDLVLASTLGLLWQAFSLTPSGYKLVAMIDDLLP